MHLSHLSLENVGPFDREELPLAGPDSEAAVTLLTGENGTGKSIVLDAIRLAFGPMWHNGIRDLRRPGDALLDLRLSVQTGKETVVATQTRHVSHPLGAWAADFWQSALANDSFEVSGLTMPTHNHYRRKPLSGEPQNRPLTDSITYFDYLRDSRDPTECEQGLAMWSCLERIVAQTVPGGALMGVRRSSFEPIVTQHHSELTLGQLSAGSLYALTRMVRLLTRMFSCQVVTQHDTPLLETPGLLLIDEAENHLHPKWQKRFIPDILEVFPNLQIIAATHSPFVVSSVPGAKVYRCRTREDGRGCTIDDVSDDYVNQPVGEVLVSDAFSGTAPYSPQIEALLDVRRAAILSGNVRKREEIEQQLVRLNPEEFAVYRIAEMLEELGEAS